VPVLDWRVPSGRAHSFLVCRDGLADVSRGASVTEASAKARADDYGTLDDATTPRITVGAAAAGDQVAADARHVPGSVAGRLHGTLVHRLLQTFGLNAPGSDTVREALERLVTPAERADVPEMTALLSRVAASYVALAADDEARAAYAAGNALHEVPFTLRREDAMVRGTIDCLVRHGGRVTVLEFKTGAPHPEHDAQAALYREAAQAIFPDAIVDARVVYVAGHDG
jgi:ATP-dependent exoDNAse (exonuclease V) beta subunit